MKYSKEDKERAMEVLRKLLKPGDTVYTVQIHVSRSGMMREISPYVIRNNAPRWIGYSVAVLLDAPMGKREGVVVGGCGMDMGFHLVYSLSRRLFPDGFGVEGELPRGRKIRPISKEMAARAVKRGAIFRGNNGDPSGWESDGGYALNHKWM